MIGAALMWATSGTAGKKLLLEGINAFDIVQTRVTLSTLLLALIFAVRGRYYLRVRCSDLAYFAVAGGVVLALTQVSYFFAISKIHVAAAILLQYLAPLLVALFSICFWQERLTVLKAVSLLLAAGGCYLMVEGYDVQLLELNRAGIIGGLISAVSFGAYTLLAERGMHRYSPWTVTFYSFLFASVSLHIVYPPFRYLTIVRELYQAVLLVHISIVGTLLSFGCYLVGINHIRSTRAAITATLEPVSAGVLAYFFLGELLTPPQLAGAALVIAAIVMLQQQRERDALAPEAIRARTNEEYHPRAKGKLKTEK